jgi:hypothetical protein
MIQVKPVEEARKAYEILKKKNEWSLLTTVYAKLTFAVQENTADADINTTGLTKEEGRI